MDDDNVGELAFDFAWHCETDSGGACLSREGGGLDMSPSVNDAVLSIPAESLPIGKLFSAGFSEIGTTLVKAPHMFGSINRQSPRNNNFSAGYFSGFTNACTVRQKFIFPPGVEYVFTVTVSKGADGGPAWSQLRSDNASCTVSTSAMDIPLASVNPKVRRSLRWICIFPMHSLAFAKLCSIEWAAKLTARKLAVAKHCHRGNPPKTTRDSESNGQGVADQPQTDPQTDPLTDPLLRGFRARFLAVGSPPTKS